MLSVKVMLNKKYYKMLKKSIDKLQKVCYSIVKEREARKTEREPEALGLKAQKL